MFILDDKRLLEEVSGRAARRVLLQLPDGLKPEAYRIAKLIEEGTGAGTIISGSSCYGACDVAIAQAEKAGADLIVHYGHTPIPAESRVPIVYLDARMANALKDPVVKSLKLLNGRRVGIGTTVQHIHKLEEVRKIVESRGKKAVVGKPSGMNRYSGQVTGCDYSTIKQIEDYVDCFLIIGSRFHALGAALSVNKRVVLADPYSMAATDMECMRDRIQRQVRTRLIRAAAAEMFGIVASSKIGQERMELAGIIRDLLRNNGREGLIIYVDDVSPELELKFPEFDAFINTACPRLAIDDAQSFRKPIINPAGVLFALGLTDKPSYLEGYTEEEMFRTFVAKAKAA